MFTRGKMLVELAKAAENSGPKQLVLQLEKSYESLRHSDSVIEKQQSTDICKQGPEEHVEEDEPKTLHVLAPMKFFADVDVPTTSGLNYQNTTGELMDSASESETERFEFSSGEDYQPEIDGDSTSSVSNEEDKLQFKDVTNDKAEKIIVKSRGDTINLEQSNNDKTIDIKIRKKLKVFPQREKVSKKRVREENKWKKNRAALARAKGEMYTSYKGVEMPAKTPDTGNLCGEKCRLKCHKNFNDEDKKRILADFYQLNIDAKNALLFKSIVALPVIRERKNAKKHKNYSYKYSITCNNKEIVVCKTAFCLLYQIGRKKVDVIQEKLKTGRSAPSSDMRGRHFNRPHKLEEQVVQTIIDHIKKFPSESSHYSRNNNPHKEYLSPILNMSIMYRLYIEECKEEQRPAKFIVKKASYSHIFSTKFNLSFSKPKSDTCSIYDAGEGNDEHKENANTAFQFQRSDREMAKKDKTVCYITIDLQQTMPLLKFYLRQLWFYNFGMHLVTSEGTKSVMQTWTEDVASRGSSEIASCLWNFVQTCNEVKNKEHLTVWSDSCAGQNKNFNIVTLYQLMVLKGIFKKIDHKFPEVGHSYLDSDRDFGRIEKVLRKNATIYTPQQYRDLIRNASTRNAHINDMQNHFRDIETLAARLGLIQRKKNLLNETVPFRNIKWLRVDEFGSYLYKETYDEFTPFKKVSLLRNKSTVPNPNFELARLRQKTGTVSEEKLENLRAQLTYVLEEHRWFYEQLLNENCSVQTPLSKKRRTN